MALKIQATLKHAKIQEVQVGMKKLVSIILIGLIFMNFGISEIRPAKAAGVIYYVATNGNDSTGNGTLTNPWKTIQRAASIMVAGDTCCIRSGTYRETVTPVNSGTSTDKITFMNYPGESVTVSGLEIVTGWTCDSGSIYKASMSWTMGNSNQVFVNGAMMDLARWPNNTGSLLIPTLAGADAGTSRTITDSDIPGISNFWKGAVLWSLGGSAWCAQATTITGYDDTTHTLTFNQMALTGSNYNPKQGSRYYLSGVKGALDTEKEWWYDADGKQLYLWAPGGVDPSIMTVEAKKRNYAFDLSDKSNVTIQGISLFGASINTTVGTAGCLIKNINGKYVAHDNGAGTAAYINILGSNNELNSCEFSYSSREVVRMVGTNNKIINCYIHDGDYVAASVSMVAVGGSHNLISHNTMSDAGKQVLGGGTTDSRIEYNDLSRAGYLTRDLGVFYISNTDSQNTVISYNKLHDNLAGNKGSGIYLDNSTQNYIVHHNVVWNCQAAGISLNTPSNYNLIYNNTCVGSSNAWGGAFGQDMYGDRIFNNIFLTDTDYKLDAIVGHNLISAAPGYVDPYPGGTDYHLQAASPAIDAGIVIPGITDGYVGSAPDIGAYEYGGPDWTAGCNFSNPPSPTFSSIDTPYMNRAVNGGFESGDMSSWTKNGAQTATIINQKAWGLETANTRTGNYGVRLGLGANGIEQIITGLQSNTTYTVSGWIKVDIGESACAGVKNYNGSAQSESSAVTADTWQKVTVDFTTGAANTSATVYFSKTSTGSGYVYCDDMGTTLYVGETIITNSQLGFNVGGTGNPGISNNVPGMTSIINASVGSYIQCNVNVPEAGYYSIAVEVRKDSNRGICQFSIDGTNVGDTKDLYAAERVDRQVLELTDEVYLQAGNRNFVFTVTGKNINSSDYILSFWDLKLLKNSDTERKQIISWDINDQSFKNGVLEGSINVTQHIENATLIAALYGTGNMLKEIHIKSDMKLNEGANAFTIPIDLSENLKGCDIKLMLWDNLSSLTPFSAKFSGYFIR